MTKITRNDGTHFIIPDYREELSNKKISVLRNEVALLSQNYGEFIYIQKNLDESYDVAFSTEPGYLLAESIVKYIKTSDNFIYIERLQNSDNVIFISLKKNKVHIDTQISIDTLYDEFIVIQAEQSLYDIYVYGNLPITDQEQESDKFFIGNVAKSFKVMEKSVFESIGRYSDFELKPANEAFSSAGLIKPLDKKIVSAIVVVVIFIILWFIWPNQKVQQVVQQVQIVNTRSSYYEYVQTLKTPGPTQELQGLILFLEKLQNMPSGWQIQSINANQNTISIALKNISELDNLEILHNWASNNGIEMTVNTNIVNLEVTTAYPARTERHDIYKTQEILRVLMDRIKPILTNPVINVSQSTPQENYNELSVTIHVSNVSFDTLDIVGEQLSDLPLLFNTAHFMQGDAGLLTGSINITIVGN